jgi:hypothetical protein
VPSVRFSRDKRGYEYVYLVHTPVKRGKPGRPRVLYWYRTPPGVRVGRKAFDDEVRQRLERQNPDLTFDWQAIVATPMPPPDMSEFWRERRRMEKAARQERRAEEAAEQATSEGASDPAATDERVDDAAADDDASDRGEDDASQTDLDDVTTAGMAATPAESGRRRGRRGRGRGGVEDTPRSPEPAADPDDRDAGNQSDSADDRATGGSDD